MIQANELRIGNYVSIGGIITTVNHIMGDEDEYEGVKLTEEILGKSGFKKVIRIGATWWDDGDGFEGYENERGNFRYERGEISYSISFARQPILKKCIYLHQLQNLYFALTQTELTITL